MINSLTLNPAIDKILYLDAIERNVTNRVRRQSTGIGGKGTHVSMTLCQMGLESQAFGLARGDAGRFIAAALEDWGVKTCFVFREQGQSRTNYILIENDGSCTTVAERGVELEASDLDELLAYMDKDIRPGDVLVLSGDASNSPDPFVYNHIMGHLAYKNLRVFLDASGETLRKGLERGPFLIKPNQDELEFLCGFPVSGDEDVIRGIRSLDSFGVEVVAVSLGGRGSLVRFGGEYYRAVPPKVEVSNTVGCGDSFLAALLYGYETGLSHAEKLRWATAVSAAAAAFPMSVGFDMAFAAALTEHCRVERIL